MKIFAVEVAEGRDAERAEMTINVVPECPEVQPKTSFLSAPAALGPPSAPFGMVVRDAAPPTEQHSVVLSQPVRHEATLSMPLLVAVTDQFNLMQQNMFDQFQQSLSLVTRNFTSMHQQQRLEAMAELDQLRKIIDQLHALRGETSPANASPNPAATVETAAVSGEPTQAGETSSCLSESSRDEVNGQPLAEKRVLRHVCVAETPADRETVLDAASQPHPTEDHVHDWLNQRILALNQEGQSRWTRLLGIILGK